MKPPVWLMPEAVLAVHAECIRAFGGSDGVRDAGLRASALASRRSRRASTPLARSTTSGMLPVSECIGSSFGWMNAPRASGLPVLP